MVSKQLLGSPRGLRMEAQMCALGAGNLGCGGGSDAGSGLSRCEQSDERSGVGGETGGEGEGDLRIRETAQEGVGAAAPGSPASPPPKGRPRPR